MNWAMQLISIVSLLFRNCLLLFQLADLLPGIRPLLAYTLPRFYVPSSTNCTRGELYGPLAHPFILKTCRGFNTSLKKPRFPRFNILP